MGPAWASFVEYEHVTIAETGHGDTRNATAVRFKTEGCKPLAQLLQRALQRLDEKVLAPDHRLVDA